MAFIVFEGLDGSGKTTQMARLTEYLRSQSLDVVVTREPGGTPLAEELREMLLRVDNEVPSSRCELLVYEASRAQHVEQVIRPALERGDWVISDRFAASSVAFQGGGRGISVEEVEWLNNFATKNLNPDLYILIDVTVDESEKRKGQREMLDRLESEKREFHQKVRDSYLAQAQKQNNWLMIDGNQTIDEIFNQIIEEFRKRKWLES